MGILRDELGNEVVFEGTARALEVKVERCRELWAKHRTGAEDTELAALLPAVFDAASAIALDEEQARELASVTNKITGHGPSKSDDMRIRQAIAGIGNANWYRVARDLFARWRSS